MTESLETRLEILSWDEKPYRELDDGRKFTLAEVKLQGTGDGIESAAFEALMFYQADGTSSYVTLMQITGRLGDRAGSFVLRGDGTFDGKTAVGASSIVPGSGTDELAGISGTMSSASTHEDYPHMPLTLTYDFA
jgi:Protein of unknown function (DUF3224)